MKKYILYFNLCLLCMLVPLGVKAYSSVSINCPKTTLNTSESITCSINTSSDNYISSITGLLSTSGNVSFSNVSIPSIWSAGFSFASGGNINVADLNASGYTIKSGVVATFTLTASSSAGSGNVNFNISEYNNADGGNESVSNASLAINVVAPTPSSNGNTNNNSNTNTNTNNNNNNSSTNNSTNNQNQNNSNNKTNETKKSNDATLKSLTLSDGNIKFSKDVYEYNIEVSNSVDKISIKAEANNSKASVDIPNDLSLKLGKNSFEIKVTAEDGTVKKYVINVDRLEKELSSNANLESIDIEGYIISFYKDVFSYNISDIEVDKLIIKTKAEDENAKVEIIGNDNLSTNDVIVIKVTAEDGTIKEYILYVNNTNTDMNVGTKKVSIPLLITCLLLLLSIIMNVVLFIKLRKKKIS